MLSNLTFEQKSRFEISKIRGAYLDMSCDLEFLLVDIACVCLLRDARERNMVKEILLSGTMLSKKINFTESALKKYNIKYYEQYKDCFAKFKDFNKWRNKFSHSRIEADKNEQDLNILLFISIENGELKEDIQDRRLLYSKLPVCAGAIHKIGSELVTTLYTERYMNRYTDILLFPSNRSLSYWHNSQLKQ